MRGRFLPLLLLLAFAAPLPAQEWEETSPPPAATLDPRARREALAALGGIENLEIRVFEEGAVLKGSLLTPQDLARVRETARTLPGVLDLTRLSPQALRVGSEYLNADLSRMGLAGLELRPWGERLALFGGPVSAAEVSCVERLCTTLGLPFLDLTRPASADRRMVWFDVCFAEVNRDAFENLGLSWPAAATTVVAGGSAAFAPGLELTVEAIRLRGQGRILSRPILACRSGEAASFLAGGEIPIPRRTEEGELSVLWKNYGISLEVAPLVDGGGNVSGRLTAEVSMLDRANAVEGIPGILSRRVGTALALAEGQTLVLSGLVNREDSRTTREIPLLASLPVLGELFRSRGYQKRETDLLIFVTPRLSPPPDFPPAASGAVASPPSFSSPLP